MNSSFPYVPINGSSPITFLLMAGLVGIGFGFFLERSGFGSAKKLTAVFTMRDWQVYRVMFTALLTAMIGSQLLSAVGILDMAMMEQTTTYIWPMFFGGILFGVGFYFGGFCPGTAVVSAVRGRLDALFFLGGIVFGIYGFALFYDGPGQESWFQSFYAPADSGVWTLDSVGPTWVWMLGITTVVILSFRFLYILEQRYHLVSPDKLGRKDSRPPVAVPKFGLLDRGIIGLTGATVLLIGLLQLGGESEPPELAIGSELAASVEVDEDPAPTIDSLSLVGWVILDADRLADEKPLNTHLLDLRNSEARAIAPVRGALVLPDNTSEANLAEATMMLLDEELTRGDKNKPLVVIDAAGSTAAKDLVHSLRDQGVNAMLVEGGAEAWSQVALSGDTPWPGWVVGAVAETETPAPVPDVAEYQAEVGEWLIGDTDTLPNYLSLPGTVQLPSEAATVAATGGGGGGCG